MPPCFSLISIIITVFFFYINHSLFSPEHTVPYISCGGIYVQRPQSRLHWIPPAIVNSDRPCDALIVEVTGISTEYAKPPCKSHQAQWITSSLRRIGHLLPRFVNREVKSCSLARRLQTTDRKQEQKTTQQRGLIKKMKSYWLTPWCTEWDFNWKYLMLPCRETPSSLAGISFALAF